MVRGILNEVDIFILGVFTGLMSEVIVKKKKKKKKSKKKRVRLVQELPIFQAEGTRSRFRASNRHTPTIAYFQTHTYARHVSATARALMPLI